MGIEWFWELSEAYRKRFHLSWYLQIPWATNYRQKSSWGILFPGTVGWLVVFQGFHIGVGTTLDMGSDKLQNALTGFSATLDSLTYLFAIHAIFGTDYLVKLRGEATSMRDHAGFKGL